MKTEIQLIQTQLMVKHTDISHHFHYVWEWKLVFNMVLSIINILKRENIRRTKTTVVPFLVLFFSLLFTTLSASIYAQKQRLTFQHIGIEHGLSSMHVH